MRIFTIPLFSLWLFPAGLVWSAEPESSGNAANEAAVAEVAASARTEANAAWWGFDPDDATAAVQAAIDSGAARVRNPDMLYSTGITRSGWRTYAHRRYHPEQAQRRRVEP